MHLLFNMFALNSFGHAVSTAVGYDHFLACFLAGGIFSSYVSQMYKLFTKDYRPSVGASGGVLALVAFSTYLYPDAQLSIIFLPFLKFSAIQMLPFIVVFDILGVLSRFVKHKYITLDHVAHLSGVLFGWCYAKYVVDNREIAKPTTYYRKY